MLYEDKVRLLKKQGFIFYNNKWYNKGRSINDYYAQNPSISLYDLEEIIAEIKLRPELPDPWPTKRKKEVPKYDPKAPKIDALTRRLPGSFGSGKRR